jgi:HlyD family secretion protein
MKSTLLLLMLLVATAATLTRVVLSGGKLQPAVAAAKSSPNVGMVVAGGRVEPISEELDISAEMGGKLRDVFVKEGDRVRAGQVIAEIENDEYRARVTAAEAELQEKAASHRRIVNGARPQERLEAEAAVTEAQAVMENDREQAERRQVLLEKGAVSHEESEHATQAYKASQARYQAAVEHHKLIDEDAREEDRARAQADVDLAAAKLEESRAQLAKTIVRAPINGVVLRKHRHRGETVQQGAEWPIVTLGDISRLRVRAEVDESDIAAITRGQKAYVTADAYGAKRFTGILSRVGSEIGKKRIVSDSPEDRVDRKVLEAFIDLAPGVSLPSGLRVDVFIETGDSIHGQR